MIVKKKETIPDNDLEQLMDYQREVESGYWDDDAVEARAKARSKHPIEKKDKDKK